MAGSLTFVFIFFNMSRILSFVFSVFYVTLTFPCHKLTWFSIVCIASALLLFGLKKHFNDNPKRFLINHEHFGAAFLVLMIFLNVWLQLKLVLINYVFVYYMLCHEIFQPLVWRCYLQMKKAMQKWRMFLLLVEKRKWRKSKTNKNLSKLFASALQERIIIVIQTIVQKHWQSEEDRLAGYGQTINSGIHTYSKLFAAYIATP